MESATGQNEAALKLAVVVFTWKVLLAEMKQH